LLPDMMAVNWAAKTEISFIDMDPSKNIEDNAMENIIKVSFLLDV
jgi:hypothetical protein